MHLTETAPIYSKSRRPSIPRHPSAALRGLRSAADIQATGLTGTAQIIQPLAPSVNFPHATGPATQGAGRVLQVGGADVRLGWPGL